MRELTVKEVSLINGAAYAMPTVLSWMTGVYAVEKKSDPLVALALGSAAGVIAGLPDFLVGTPTLSMTKLAAFSIAGAAVGTGISSYFSPLEKIYVVEADGAKT